MLSCTNVLVPRAGTSALSVRYTGYEPTFEIRALWNLATAPDVAEGIRALRDFSYGGQNWTMIDNHLSIGWSTHAKVPLRGPGAYTWNATTNPGGVAPFFVQPVDAASVPVIGELHTALSAGDDYELLFTSRPSQRGRLRGVRRQAGDLPITRIGVVTKGRDVLLRDDQGTREMPRGYEHWKS